MGRGVLALQRWPDHTSTRPDSIRSRIYPGGRLAWEGSCIGWAICPPATGSRCSWSGSRWRSSPSSWSRSFGAKTNNSSDLPGTDSQAAFDLLADEFPPQQNGTNPFVFHVDRGTLTDPDAKAAIDATYKAHARRAARGQRDEPGLEARGRRRPVVRRRARSPSCRSSSTSDSGFITEDLAEKVLAATEPARDGGHRRSR